MDNQTIYPGPLSLLGRIDIESSDLDELVREAASAIASAVNNGGKREQLGFLEQSGYTRAEVLEALDLPE